MAWMRQEPIDHRRVRHGRGDRPVTSTNNGPQFNRATGGTLGITQHDGVQSRQVGVQVERWGCIHHRVAATVETRPVLYGSNRAGNLTD